MGLYLIDINSVKELCTKSTTWAGYSLRDGLGLRLVKVDARPLSSMTQTACRSQTTAATKGGGEGRGEERGTLTGSWTVLYNTIQLTLFTVL